MRRTLSGMLARSFAAHADRPALLAASADPGSPGPVSHRALGELVRDVAGGFASLGLARGDRIAFVGTRRAGALLAELGAAFAGLVPVFTLGPGDGASGDAAAVVVDDVASLARLARTPEHAVILRAGDAGSSGDGPAPVALEELRARGRAFRSTDAGVRSLQERLDAVQPDDVAYVVASAGARSGEARAVEVRHGAIVHQITVLPDALGLRAGDVALAPLPLAHAIDRAVLLAVLAAGGALAVTGAGEVDDDASTETTIAAEVETLARSLLAARPSLIVANPGRLAALLGVIEEVVREPGHAATRVHRLLGAIGAAHVHARRLSQGLRPRGRSEPFLRRIVARSRGALGAALLERPARFARDRLGRRLADALGGRLRTVVAWGAPVADATDLALATAGVTVLEAYGLAEAAGVVAVRRASRPVPGTCGPALPASAVRIVDPETGELLGRGRDGAIEVRGPGVATGGAREEWLATGDLGRLTDWGEVRPDGPADVLDRFAGGADAPAIEARVASSPFIARAVVVASPREGDGRRRGLLCVVDRAALAAELGEAIATDADLAARLQRDDVRSLFVNEIARTLLQPPATPPRPLPRGRLLTRQATGLAGRLFRRLAERRAPAVAWATGRFLLLASDLVAGVEIGPAGRVRRAELATRRAAEIADLLGEVAAGRGATPTPNASSPATERSPSPRRALELVLGVLPERLRPVKV